MDDATFNVATTPLNEIPAAFPFFFFVFLSKKSLKSVPKFFTLTLLWKWLRQKQAAIFHLCQETICACASVVITYCSYLKVPD